MRRGRCHRGSSGIMKAHTILMGALLLLPLAAGVLSARAADEEGIPIVSGEPVRPQRMQPGAQPRGAAAQPAARTAPGTAVSAAGSALTPAAAPQAAPSPLRASPDAAAALPAAPAALPAADASAPPAPAVALPADDGRPRFSAALDHGVEQALLQAFLAASGQTLLSGDAEHPDPELLQAVATAAAGMHIAGDSLSVSFEPGRVEELVRTYSGLMYGGIASPVVAFIAISRPSGSRIVNQESSLPLVELLHEQARRLSFRVLYPLMDLSDVQAVVPETVLSHDGQTLARAAARYEAGYFISAALSGAGTERLSVVWDLHDREGRRLHGTTSAGRPDEVAAQMALAVARAVHEQGTPASAGAAAEAAPPEDAFALGPRSDVVRVAVSNVNSLNDLLELNTALITYGFDGEGQIVGLREGAVYMDIPTSAAPDILDGSMSHAQDFRKIGEWQYEWINTTGH